MGNVQIGAIQKKTSKNIKTYKKNDTEPSERSLFVSYFT